MNRRPVAITAVLAPALALPSACGEAYPHPDTPVAFAMPEFLNAALREKVGLPPLPEDYTLEQFIALDRERLATIRELDVPLFREHEKSVRGYQPDHHGLRWLSLLPNLEILSLDLSEPLGESSEIGSTAGMTFMRVPRVIDIHPDVGLQNLRSLTVTTNAPQNLRAFATLPKLERLTVRSRAPIDLSVFGNAPALRTLTIVSPDGPHHFYVAGSPRPGEPDRLRSLRRLRELDLTGEFSTPESYGALADLPALRSLTVRLPVDPEPVGLESLTQLETLRLIAAQFTTAEALAALRERLVAALPDCRVTIVPH